ncbi:MAG: site-specific DNA-methyltransferase, partial [Methyloversatilis sp.]|nr:site-specific DNA-methyltransferase [Methyloversatilis sp.]
MAKPLISKSVEQITHDEAKRKNIPTAEYQSVLDDAQKNPKQVRYPRNTDLDPQLVWRGKDEQDWSDLVVHAPPLYIQEKVHPKALIDDLLRQTKESEHEAGQTTPDLFSDFNGIPKGADKTEFYAHDQNWSNRMILGDSLQVMASLAEREGLRGKVQCIYFDPPYGIKFNSNFQWSTTSTRVKDGKADHITREPEQVKAFRDTWRDGIHSYLTYLRDRLTVARDLLTDSGSIFVQIGDENVHRVRALMDEVFGEENYSGQITVVKTAGQSSELIAGTADFVLWYAKQRSSIKFRNPLLAKGFEADKSGVYKWVRQPDGSARPLLDEERAADQTTNVFAMDNISSQRPPGDFPVHFGGRTFGPGKGYWKTGEIGMGRLIRANRIGQATNSLRYVRFLDDFRAQAIGNVWNDTGTGSFTDEKIYVVQSGTKLVQRCILMATDPGDLVLDPTCGSGTTATVAEQWGRRWITIDTSRVALALARARIMGARYPFYLLADSREGQIKEAEVTRTAPSTQPVHGNIRHGFVYERVPHITLKSIANNAEIDVIWEHWHAKLEPLREQLNSALDKAWQEWDIPRDADSNWPASTKALHTDWWQARIARQQEIDKSIAARAEFEFLYDKPYDDRKKVRVAGPFTV